MKAQPQPQASKSLKTHLIELRNYFFATAAVAMVFSLLGYQFRDDILPILLKPLEGQQLSYLAVGGGFQFIFQVTIWCGLLAALPVLMFLTYRFIAPALPERARNKSIIVLICSILLLVSGALFGYFIAIPGAINFLTGFADEYVQSMLTADSYLGFVFAYTIGLGVLFQLPLLLVLINWAKPLGPSKLWSFERWVIVGAFILAAIITPTPDAVNMAIVAAPIIALYQIGFFVVVWINWQAKRQEAKYAKAHPAPAVAPESAQPTVQHRSIQPQPVVYMHNSAAQTVAQPPTQRPRRSMDGFVVSAVKRDQLPIVVPKRNATERAAMERLTRPQSSRSTPRRSIDGVSIVGY